MSEIKQCKSCGTKLLNKRRHTLTCSNTCRWRVWQAKQTPMIPVRLTFSIQQFEAIKDAAGMADKSINEYMQDRIVRSECVA